MTLIPDWAPNIHPILVHFPIVLLLLAPAFELGLILLKKRDGLVQVVNLLHLAAAISVGLVFISGKIAADSVNIPSQAYTTLSNHANLASYTLIIALANGSLRGWLFIWKSGIFTGTWLGLVSGLLALVMLIPTADKGAKLVFLHGVGVSATETEYRHNQTGETDQPQNLDEDGDRETESHIEHERKTNIPVHAQLESEPFVWSAATSTLEDFKHQLEIISLNADELNISRVEHRGSAVVRIELENQEALILFSGSLANIELSAQLNFDEFDGVVRLVHHVADGNQYDFLESTSASVTLGRIMGGEKKIYDSADAGLSGMVSLKAVGSAGHLRGYANQQLYAHGHAGNLPEGRFGLYIQGQGRIDLAELIGIDLGAE